MLQILPIGAFKAGQLTAHWVTLSLNQSVSGSPFDSRMTLETCDPWDIWSEWWENMTLPKFNICLGQFWNFWQFWQFFDKFFCHFFLILIIFWKFSIIWQFLTFFDNFDNYDIFFVILTFLDFGSGSHLGRSPQICTVTNFSEDFLIFPLWCLSTCF